MQLTQKRSEVSTNVEGQSQVIGVMSGNKASFVLSHDIYSSDRVIEAVLREVSCNAMDSHIEAGNANPIEVTLPTIESPMLIIEDQGIGLTKSDVFRLMGNYFSSDSENRKKATGYYGLGSKSPFAYCDMFSIEAVKDGVKSLVQAYENENGEYELVETGSLKVVSPNGVKIIVPSKVSDIEEFKKAAVKVFSFSMVSPHVNNNEEVRESIKKARKALYIESLALAEKESESSVIVNIDSSYLSKEDTETINEQGTNHLVYGGVSYPMNFEKIVAKVKKTISKVDANILCSISHRLLWVNIEKTAIQVSPSREVIQYSEANCRAIAELALQSYKKKLKEIRVMAEKSKFDAKDALLDLVGSHVFMQICKDVVGVPYEVQKSNIEGVKLTIVDGSARTRSEVFSSGLGKARVVKRIFIIRTHRALTNDHVSRFHRNALLVTINGYQSLPDDEKKIKLQAVLDDLGNPSEYLTHEDFSSVVIQKSVKGVKRRLKMDGIQVHCSKSLREGSGKDIYHISQSSITSEAVYKMAEESPVIYSERRLQMGTRSLSAVENLMSAMVEITGQTTMVLYNKDFSARAEKDPENFIHYTTYIKNYLASIAGTEDEVRVMKEIQQFYGDVASLKYKNYTSAPTYNSFHGTEEDLQAFNDYYKDIREALSLGRFSKNAMKYICGVSHRVSVNDEDRAALSGFFKHYDAMKSIKTKIQKMGCDGYLFSNLTIELLQEITIVGDLNEKFEASIAELSHEFQVLVKKVNSIYPGCVRTQDENGDDDKKAEAEFIAKLLKADNI